MKKYRALKTFVNKDLNVFCAGLEYLLEEDYAKNFVNANLLQEIKEENKVEIPEEKIDEPKAEKPKKKRTPRKKVVKENE